jgi:hypothetical protein
MKTAAQLKTATPPIFIMLAIAYFGLLPPDAFGVVPAPDGGYPGGNTAEGQAALLSLTTGGFNTAVGWLSLRSNTEGKFNTGVGAGTLLANTADENTAIGAGALLATSGGQNTATGAFALFNNTTGIQNTASGILALFNNTTGSDNTASGLNALASNTTGEGNTAVGDVALLSNTTGNFNTALGLLAGSNISTADNVICIGAVGFDVSDSCFIGNIRGASVSPDAIPVLVDSSDKLGTMTSSKHFKEGIKPMGKSSEALLALKPVTFHYKSDKTSTPQFGLIAEEAAEVNPSLVVRDKEGKPYTVRYDQVNAMLLNEFLKEHKTVQELKSTLPKQEATVIQLKDGRANHEATISDLKKVLGSVVARLNEQDSKIQKVSDQLKFRKPARYAVASDQ